MSLAVVSCGNFVVASSPSSSSWLSSEACDAAACVVVGIGCLSSINPSSIASSDQRVSAACDCVLHHESKSAAGQVRGGPSPRPSLSPEARNQPTEVNDGDAQQLVAFVSGVHSDLNGFQ